MRRALLAVLGLAAALPCGAGEPRLAPPLAVDADDRPIPLPARRRATDMYEVLYNSWLRHADLEQAALAVAGTRSLDVNHRDEVPDSSWFTNRIGARPLSFEEIRDGLPGSAPGPRPWTVVRIHGQGLNDAQHPPKLDVVDGAGRKFVFKFDPEGSTQRYSGAERLSTLVMHAAGYNVPHNSLVHFRRGDLAVPPAGERGERGPSAAELEHELSLVAHLPDGRYRSVASMYLPGKPLGPALYTGRRKDDANDILAHQLRRELRGLRVIASWVNHVDVKGTNTFDAYVGEDGRGHVVHYLIDFGSTLGGGDFTNGPLRVGHEFLFDGAAMLRSLVSLGAWQRPWDARGRIVHPEIGYFPVELFEPERWRPNYPNVAFQRMDLADAYWGAKIVTAFDDELVAALAASAEYLDPAVERDLAATLRARRDAIGRTWLERVTALESPRLEGPAGSLVLRFDDLAAGRGHASGARAYRYAVRDASGRRIGALAEASEPVLPLTAAALQAEPAPADRWSRRIRFAVRVEARRSDGSWAAPAEVIVGADAAGEEAVLGWRHAVD